MTKIEEALLDIEVLKAEYLRGPTELEAAYEKAIHLFQVSEKTHHKAVGALWKRLLHAREYLSKEEYREHIIRCTRGWNEL